MRVIAYPAFKNVRDNPYNHTLYSKMRDCGVFVIEHNRKRKKVADCDIFHFHWPEFFINRKSVFTAIKSMAQTFFLIDRMRQHGTKIVWTIHDLKPHEPHFPVLERRYWNGMARRLDGVIALTEGGLELAREKLPAIASIPSFVIPHGHYRDVYPRTITRSEAREKLGVAQSNRVFASVGQLRPYKNIPILVRAFRGLDRPDAALLISGNPISPEIEGEIRSAAGEDARIRLFLGWIEDEDLQLYFKAADLLVFPYRDILNSGSALLGLSFDRPVLVPRLGAMAELQKFVGSNWVRTYEGDLNAATLGDAIDWALTEKRGQHAPLSDLDWCSIARRTIAAYRSIMEFPV